MVRKKDIDKLLEKFDEIRISFERDNARIGESIDEINRKLEELERDSTISLDDQLIFGLTFSLLIVFLTIQFNAFTDLIRTALLLDQALAVQVTEIFRYIAVTIMLVSSFTRYGAAITEEDLSKRLRFLSTANLLIGLNFLLFIVTLSIMNSLPQYNSYFSMPLFFTLWLSSFIYVPMILLERKLLCFYAIKQLISRGHAVPYISTIFLTITSGFWGVFLITNIPITLGFRIISFELGIFIWGMWALFGSIFIAYLMRRKVEQLDLQTVNIFRFRTQQEPEP